MLLRCYAKINLTLEIVGKRPDGFHELASLVHTVSLADELGIEPAPKLVTHVEGMDLDPEANLVSRAAALLAARLGRRDGANLSLVKHIPAAAGLGGGSSDAAATLAGLSSLWNARLMPSRLRAIAAELGSDVPYFVQGGAALMRGRGDDLVALPPLRDQWLVLLAPAHTIADKTRRLYAALEPRDFSPGVVTRQAAERLARGLPLDEGELVNGFERAARRVFPGLDELWRATERASGRRLFLSGAGPALFTLVASRAEAHEVASRLSRPEARAFAVRTVKHARIASRRGHRVRLSATCACDCPVVQR
jgi:4-diphosphocytidyl-2-C-methyl-D-erythritol kinase